MTSNAPSHCCFSGFKFDGSPRGQVLQNFAGDQPAYVVKPPADKTRGKEKKAILYLSDVLTYKFKNAQLTADQFADQGFLVVAPDLFHDDDVLLNPPPNFDVLSWVQQHGPDRVDPVVEAAIKKLKSPEYGIDTIHAVGYCFGARYVVEFMGDVGRSRDAVINGSSFLAHPSWVQADDLRTINAPLSIAAAQTDTIFTVEQRHDSEKILSDLSSSNEKLSWEIHLYSNVSHGFAVRGDLSDNNAAYARAAAFEQAVKWFDTH